MSLSAFHHHTPPNPSNSLVEITRQFEGRAGAIPLQNPGFHSGTVYSTEDRLSFPPGHEMSLDPVIARFFPDKRSNTIGGGVNKDGNQTSVVCRVWKDNTGQYTVHHDIAPTNYFASVIGRAIKEDRAIIAEWAEKFAVAAEAIQQSPALSDITSNPGKLGPQSQEVVWKTLTQVCNHFGDAAPSELRAIAASLTTLSDEQVRKLGPDGANASYLGFTLVENKLHYVTYVKGAQVLGGNSQEPLKGSLHGALATGNVSADDLKSADGFHTACKRHAQEKLGGLDLLVNDSGRALYIFEGNNQHNLARIVFVPDFSGLVEQWRAHSETRLNHLMAGGKKFEDAISKLDPPALALIPVGNSKDAALAGTRVFALSYAAESGCSVVQSDGSGLQVRPYFTLVKECIDENPQLSAI